MQQGAMDVDGYREGDARQCGRAVGRARRHKTAAERRQQHTRAEAHALSRLLCGFTSVSGHHGCQLSRVGACVLAALQAEAGQPMAPAAVASAAGGVPRAEAPIFSACHEDVLDRRVGAVSCTGPLGAVGFPAARNLDSRPTAAAVGRPSSRPSVWRVVGSSQVAKVHDSPSFVARVARTLPPGGLVRGMATDGCVASGVPWVALTDEPGFVAVRIVATDFLGLGIIPARTILELCEPAEATPD